MRLFKTSGSALAEDRYKLNHFSERSFNSGCRVVEDDSPGNRIGQHAFKHVSRQ